jgi:capsular exopolysaccharide synthesis family protein
MVTPAAPPAGVAAQPPVPGAGRGPRHAWDYWRILWEGRRILGVTLGGTTVMALVGTLLVASRYRAEVLLEINLAQATILGTEAERGMARVGFYEQDQAFKTEFVKMASRERVKVAIDRNDLLKRVPGLGRTKDPVGLLKRMISVERVPQSGVARLGVAWWSPEEAALLANAVAETYVAYDLEKRDALIDERVAKLSASAEERSAEHVKVLARELALVRRGVAALELIAKLERSEKNGTLEDLRKSLADVDTEMESLSATLGRNHEDVRAKAAERSVIVAKLEEEIDAIRTQIEDEYRASGGDPATVAELTPEELGSLSQQSASSKFGQTLLEKLLEQKALAQLLEPKAVIIDRALPPKKPFAPSLKLNLALAVVVGLGLGGGLVFFREYLDASIKTLEDVERDLGLNVLAVVPMYEGTPDRIVRESFDTMRTGLLFASRGREDRVLLVTSGGPREGKTSVVAELARSFAAAGESVVAVDADLRRPSLARHLGVAGARGLSNLLADASEASWRTFVQAVEVPGGGRITVLPTGPVPPNPLSLLGLPRFAELVSELKGAHDWVVIDSPPVSSVSDSLVLASLAEMVVVVIRHDGTDKEVVRRALQRLRAVEARVVGAVIAGVDMTRSYNRDYYYGRFFYGQYYGEGGEAQPRPATGWRGAMQVAGKKILKG